VVGTTRAKAAINLLGGACPPASPWSPVSSRCARVPPIILNN
jgi:hypothetical protein